jgi:hypothetical protein
MPALGPVEIDSRVVAVQVVVAREGVDERRIDALGFEYIQQPTQMDGLSIPVRGRTRH